MVVTTWAWLPLRPSGPVLSARGPLLSRSGLVGFAPAVANVSALPPAISARETTAAPPPAAPPASRGRDAVASLIVPPPASPSSGGGTSVASEANGHPSNGYRSEPAAVETAPLTMASPPAKPVTPPARAPSSPAVNAAPPAPTASGASRTAPAAVPVDRRIYSAADAGVEPPTMVRPQMPSEPKPDSEIGDSWVEVVVDEQGQVARVRLHSSDLSLNDRMIVSAAKAWQFQPALKDGRPVKYVLRLPVVR
jgi:protein TonB